MESMIDLSDLVAEDAKRCQGELTSALQHSDEPVENLRAALQDARARLLRLGVLLESSLSPEMGGVAAAKELRSCRQLERYSAQLLQVGDTMARLRHGLAADFAVRQADVDVATSMLANVGCWPPMTEQLVTSIGQRGVMLPLPDEHHRQAQERLRLEMLSRLALSSCLDNPTSSDAEVTPQLLAELRSDGIRLTCPGAFTIRAVFDLRSWQVLEAATSVGRSHGFAVSRNDEEALRRQLQLAVNSKGGDCDAPSVLCSIATAFCSHLWLRVLHDEACEITRAGQSELLSARWDRRGVVVLRMSSDLDLDCDDNKAEHGLASVVDGEGDTGLTLGPEENGSKRRYLVVELHRSACGGIYVETIPMLGLRLTVSPLELEQSGASYLEDLIATIRQRLALARLREVQAVLATALPQQDAVAELFEEGPALRVILRGCPLYVLIGVVGNIYVCAEGWSEEVGTLQTPRPQNHDRISSCTVEDLLARLESARVGALIASITVAGEAEGWHLVAAGSESDALLSSSSRPLARKLVLGLGGLSGLSLQLELHDSEVEVLALTLPTGCEQAIDAAARLPLRCLQGFRFEGCASELRRRAAELLNATREAVGQLTLGVQTLENLESYRKQVLAAGCGMGGTLPHANHVTLDVALESAGLSFCMTWPLDESWQVFAARCMPFVPPLRVHAVEERESLVFAAALRSAAPLVGFTKPRASSGQEPIDGAGPLLAELASGCRVRAQGPLVKDLRGVLHVHALVLEYDLRSGATWQRWPTDLRNLALLLEFCRQAVGEEAARLADPSSQRVLKLLTCGPGRLRWSLLGRKDVATEVFDFAEADGANVVDADGGRPSCCFSWQSPHPDSILKPCLSVHACRTRDLIACLRILAASLELARVVECVTQNRKDWVAKVVSPRTVSIEVQGSISMELCAAAVGVVIDACTTRRGRHAIGNRAEVPNLDEFMRLLNRPLGADAIPPDTDAPFSGLRYEVGTLAKRLTPLWDYIHVYSVLLQVHLLLVSRSSKSKPSLKRKKNMDLCSEFVSWAVMEWPADVLKSSVRLELCTRRVAEEVVVPMPPAKRCRISKHPSVACSERSILPSSVGLVAFLRFQIQPIPHCSVSIIPSETDAHVLQGFRDYFDAVLSSQEKVRASQVFPVLVLLNSAPSMWILEDAVSLLSVASTSDVGSSHEVICTAKATSWQLSVSTLSLARCAAKTKLDDSEELVLRFQLVPALKGGAGGVSKHCRAVRCAASDALRTREGWSDVRVNGEELRTWCQKTLPPESHGKRPTGGAAPYRLTSLVKLLCAVA